MKPRLGFVGVGWIGRNRMQAVLEAGRGEVVAIADPSAAMRDAAHALAPDAMLFDSLDEMLAQPLDGVVIATPNALHAAQSIQALNAGVAVFCQKPLGRTEAEVAGVVSTARKADRLLGVDLSYRHTRAMAAVREQVGGGGLGRIHAVDLTFHNAYGPDKGWFYDHAQSGGGCVMDLGVHLVDLCLWTLGFPAVEAVSASLFAGGIKLHDPTGIEDFAYAQLDLAGGVTVRLACSWKLHLGRDAAISADFHGTIGGASMRNVDGSFYDFVAERHDGTRTILLAAPPDPWGGRAITDWVDRLTATPSFDPDCAQFIEVARVLDQIRALP